ncbi:WD40 repeat-like protein [Imleria badia]|nr:WD40 repeat-like protein [Imleria badia]
MRVAALPQRSLMVIYTVEAHNVFSVFPRLVTNCHTTIMSSVILQRSDNDGPRPKLVISGNDERTIAYLPDGRVVTGSWDGFVTVRNAENWTQEGTSMEQKNCMDSLTVTRDGTRIVTSNRRGSIKIWDVESHKLAKEWTHPETCLGVAISPNDLLIAVAADTVVFYAMEGIRVNHSIKVGENVWSMSFSPDGKKLACGSGNDIRVYDVERGTLVLGPLHGHEDNVRCMLWSRDGSRLFSASHDKMIRCWNSDTGEKIGHPWSGHTGQIRFLSLSPDGSILASASWDNTVRFWDTTGHPIGDHLQHGIGVNVVCFSPSGEFVASAGLDRKIYLWRVPYSLDSVESRAMNAPHNIGLAGGPFTTAHPITSSAVPISPPTPPIWDPNPHEKDFSETSAMVPPDMQYILPESTHQPQLLQAARSAPDVIPLRPQHNLIRPPPPRWQWNYRMKCPPSVPLHQISHSISPDPMISMPLEEVLVMYIGVGILMTVLRRRFELGI